MVFRNGYPRSAWETWWGCMLVAILASPCAASTMSYEFVPSESRFVLTGGYMGVNETYSVEGSFALDVDVDAKVASFLDVDATLVNPSGTFGGWSLDSLLKMTEATGTVVDATSIDFSYSSLSTPVLLHVQLLPGSLSLVGENDTSGVSDAYHFEIDAEAVAVPEPTSVALCIGGLVGLLRFRPRRCRTGR